MLNLIVKDFLLLNRNLIKQALIWIIFIVTLQFLGAPAVYIGIPVLMTYGCLLSSYGFSEKNNVDILISSLPVNRKEVVLSKYLSALIFLSLSIGVNTVFSTAIKLTGFSHINRFINIEDISICLVFIVLYVSIYIPIYLLFGYSKTRIFGEALQYIMILGLILVIMMVTFAYNGTAASYIMKFFSRPHFKFRMCTSSLVSSIIIVSISICISLKIYINREF